MYKRSLFWWTLLSFISGYCYRANAQSAYQINLDIPDKIIETGYLDLGGVAPDGGSISVNSYYMELNESPFIPIMGEIHYTRIPNEQWEEQILKVKSGGVNVICTYVFWNIHEETEGVFDWDGDKDLRKFISLCQKHNMKTLVRIGPFCHGEIRNGGIPDWLYGRPFLIRTNDREYLKYVDRLYAEIASQLEGFFHKDGGCIIGIQLENELQHSAAPWAIRYPDQPIDYTVADYDVQNTKFGVSVQEQDIQSPEAGNQHMKTLKEIALSHGMEVPLYTATGWGNAAIIPQEVIPVTAAYTYLTWADIGMSPFYLFRDIHTTPDYSPVRYEGYRYPSFCAEMGVGIQMTYGRRPRIPAEAGEGLMVRSLGSGANGIGYYMYHGGITPQGKKGFFSDEPSGVPKMSYDFQAPIGEFGHTRASYHSLRIIHHFVNDFGHLLAPMGVVLPEHSDTITPSNTHTLRYAVRKKENAGFVFITNFQDHCKREDLRDVSLTLKLASETVRFPQDGTVTVVKNANIILPFNMDLDGILLKSATLQPLARITSGGKKHYFFFAPEGMKPEYIFAENTVKGGTKKLIPVPGLNSTVRLKSIAGKEILITTLTREQALAACKVTVGKEEKLLITSADVLQEDAKVRIQSTDTILKAVAFPTVRFITETSAKINKKKYYSEISFTKEGVHISPEVYMASERRFQVHLPEGAFRDVSDLILSIDYIGDTGAAFINGEMVADNFYHGSPWRIGLKRYAEVIQNDGIYFYLQQLFADATYLQDLPEGLRLDFSKGGVCQLNKIQVIPEYYATFTIGD